MRKALIVMFVIALIAVVIFIIDTPHRKSAALVKAIKTEDYDRVEQMLKSGVDPNIGTTSDFAEFILNIVESGGQRPISVACDIGNFRIVKLLVDYGATAEVIEDDGDWSPLRYALFDYQPEDKKIIELLLNNGADVYEKGSYEPVVFTAAQMIPSKYYGERINGTYYEDEYNSEVAKGITEIVGFMLDYGNIDVNITKSNGDTLLIVASKKGNKELVEYLLSAGCDKTAKNKLDKTALDCAVETGNEEIINLLR